jgi:hypothetical protein
MDCESVTFHAQVLCTKQAVFESGCLLECSIM